MMKIDSYQEAENMIYRSYERARPYIPAGNDSVTRYPKRTRELLDKIGALDQGMKVVLVTGSKGKGSTSYFIASLLAHAGWKVGLFTSPHLVHFTERIRVNGKPIEKEDFTRICRAIAPVVENIEEQLEKSEYLGPVGVALGVALTYFQEQRIDFAVIEAGRGGTYDDTNVLFNECAVITSIFEEHLEQLGPTLQDIVHHKLGVIKANTKKVIINRQSTDVLALMQRQMAQDDRFLYYDADFKAEQIYLDSLGTHFGAVTQYAVYPNLSMPLLGSFQAANATTAIQTVECILGHPLPYDKVKNMFEAARWPGRCEIISQDPTIIVDGTINAVSAHYIEEIIAQIGFKKIITIIGVPSDKDYEGVIRVASLFSEKLILTEPDLSHKSFPEDALRLALTYLEQAMQITPLERAFEYAKRQQDIDLILILGTQTLIGNVKRLFLNTLSDL